MNPTDLTPILIPQVSVNEELVTISSIFAKPGNKIRVGETVFSVSTSKAVIEVDAEAEGYFWPVVEIGEQVQVGAVAAYLSPTAERPTELAKPAQRATASPLATQKAITLAEKLQIDLKEIVQRGIIRESDVTAFAARSTAAEVPAAANVSAAASQSVVSGATTSARRGSSSFATGRVDQDFVTAIRQPQSGFAQLSSELKVLLYRKHGALVGDNVSFGPGAVIYAEVIEIGNGCEFGANTVIQAETLHLGVGCLFGQNNDIMCRRVRIGDMLFLVNRVLIGQGGAFNEDARLIVGHSCLISSDCLINTAAEVTIGDRSCLSPKVSIFTHSHWQNVLEGYQATFASVAIGNDVWITGNCILTPGAIMEDGSQALANSVITGRIHARTIVSGVPAQPVSKVRGELSFNEKDRLMRNIWREIENALSHAGLDPTSAMYTADKPDASVKATVQMAFGARPPSYEGTFFDLNTYRVTGPNSPAADEVRNVLRKQGIRFEPHVWRYRADMGKFNA